MKSTPKIKRSKYGNEKVVYQGIEFDSRLEMNRYIFLKAKEDAGEISNLRVHQSYELIPKQTKTEVKHLKTKDKVVEKTLFLPITFTPDFVYERNGETTAEDTKGSKFLVSADFPLRRKLLYWRHGVYVNIITKPTVWE